MKYIYLTLQYLFKLDKGKRFLFLMLFALPPCLALAYFFPITGYFDWFISYTGNYTSYPELWLSLMNRNSLQIGLLILGYILLVISISAITTIIIRSLRIGKFQVKSLFYLINENFFPALYLITFFIISLILFQSLICLFLFLWQTLPGITLGFILSIAITLIGLVLMTLGYSNMVLWLPIMSINGLRPLPALGTSYSKNNTTKKSVFVAYLLAIVFVLMMGYLSYTFKNAWYLSWIINAISYAFMTIYFSTLSILAFFDIEGITREDLVKRPYLRR